MMRVFGKRKISEFSSHIFLKFGNFFYLSSFFYGDREMRGLSSVCFISIRFSIRVEMRCLLFGE